MAPLRRAVARNARQNRNGSNTPSGTCTAASVFGLRRGLTSKEGWRGRGGAEKQKEESKGLEHAVGHLHGGERLRIEEGLDLESALEWQVARRDAARFAAPPEFLLESQIVFGYGDEQAI